MSLHVFFASAAQDAKSLIATKELGKGKFATFCRAFLNGKLSEPPEFLVEYPSIEEFNNLYDEVGTEDEDETRTRAEGDEDEEQEAQGLPESPLIPRGEFPSAIQASRPSSFPLPTSGTVVDVFKVVLLPVVVSAANLLQELHTTYRRIRRQVVEAKRLTHNIYQFSYTLAILLRAYKGPQEPQKTACDNVAFDTALKENLEIILKGYAMMTMALLEGLKKSINLGIWSNRNGIESQLHFTRLEWKLIEKAMNRIMAQVCLRTTAGLILNVLPRPRMLHFACPTLVNLHCPDGDDESKLFLQGDIVPLWYAFKASVGDVLLIKTDGTIVRTTDMFSHWLSVQPLTAACVLTTYACPGTMTDLSNEGYSIRISRPKLTSAGQDTMLLAREWLLRNRDIILGHYTDVDKASLVVVTGVVKARQFTMTVPTVPTTGFETFIRDSKEEDMTDGPQAVVISVIGLEK
ncbi:hypothetical protein ARMGADRAFT_1060891 [Armillaria gallica]|uniref:Uncharacterized protein n=1 Tax=Armillaria gallica TaxID=47427 RepID=A0A2H3EEA1_ARMGA|nr:hypothetical protein ARMGADRAFT_1060891 [Armillaria gallica]